MAALAAKFLIHIIIFVCKVLIVVNLGPRNIVLLAQLLTRLSGLRPTHA